jgi:hypothetical protein
MPGAGARVSLAWREGLRARMASECEGLPPSEPLLISRAECDSEKQVGGFGEIG